MEQEELREKIARILIRDRSILANLSKNMDTDIEDILALIKEAGYVKLADDQMPPNYVTFNFQDRQRVDEVQRVCSKRVGGK